MKNLNLIVIALAFSVSGCATLFGSSQQMINVRASNGQTFEGQLSNGTPFKAPGTVSFSKSGSQPVKIITNDRNCAAVTTVDKTIAGIFWGNVITGGLLGSGTDYISGKMWTYDENVIIACRK
jgi:hypothetical protein